MNKKTLFIVVILVLVIVGLYFLLENNGVQKETEIASPTPIQTEESAPTPPSTTTDQTMIDCSNIEDPTCFISRANTCLPVKTRMVSSDNTTQIEIIILGIENEKCHFQRKINDAMDLNCYFPKDTNIMNAIDQTFGNDHGLQEVVDTACANW